jgi:hypothetical protein
MEKPEAIKEEPLVRLLFYYQLARGDPITPPLFEHYSTKVSTFAFVATS